MTKSYSLSFSKVSNVSLRFIQMQPKWLYTFASTSLNKFHLAITGPYKSLFSAKNSFLLPNNQILPNQIPLLFLTVIRQLNSTKNLTVCPLWHNLILLLISVIELAALYLHLNIVDADKCHIRVKDFIGTEIGVVFLNVFQILVENVPFMEGDQKLTV